MPLWLYRVPRLQGQAGSLRVFFSLVRHAQAFSNVGMPKLNYFASSFVLVFCWAKVFGRSLIPLSAVYAR